MSSYWSQKGKYQEDVVRLRKFIPGRGASHHPALELLRLMINAYYDMHNNGDLQLEQEALIGLLQNTQAALVDTGEVAYEQLRELIVVLKRGGSDRSMGFVRDLQEDYPGLTDKVIDAIVVNAKKYESEFLPAKTLTEVIEDSEWNLDQILQEIRAFISTDNDLSNRVAYHLQAKMREEQRPKVKL